MPSANIGLIGLAVMGQNLVLNLERNAITNSGAAGLAESPFLPDDLVLEISMNDLTSKGVNKLRRRFRNGRVDAGPGY